MQVCSKFVQSSWQYVNSYFFLQVGALVLKKGFIRKKRKGVKLDDRWLGPYTVSQDLGKGFYSLSKGNDVIIKRINGAHVKIYERTHDDDDEGKHLEVLTAPLFLYLFMNKLN